MNLRRILLYLKLDAKSFMRGKTGPFFLIVFPIILILLFGSIFGSSGATAKTTLVVQNLDPGNDTWGIVNSINQTGLFSVVVIAPDVNISTYIAQNSIDSALQIPENFSVEFSKGVISLTYYSNPSNQIASALGQTLANEIAQSYNSNLTGSKSVLLVSRPVLEKFSKTIDYYIPGFIGFTILSGVFALIYQVPNYREKKIFRQLSFVGLTKSEWLAASVIFFTLSTFISDLVLVGIGYAVFDANLSLSIQSILLSAVVIFLGMISFLSIGLLAGLLTKEENSASLIGNVIFYPMLFLSGVFFPISDMPAFLQVVSEFLPLTYFIKALDNLILFDNIQAVVLPITIMAVTAVLLFFVASYIATNRERL